MTPATNHRVDSRDKANAEQAVRSAATRRAGEYADMLGAPSQLLHEDPLSRSVNSSIISFEFLGEGPRTGFVIKLVHDPNVVDAAASEYANLNMLYPHFDRNSDLRVPRALDCFPEFGAVVMERVFAPTLEQRILANAVRRLGPRDVRLAEHCRRCGRWVRALLATTANQDQAACSSDFEALWSGQLGAMLERASVLGLAASLAKDLEALLTPPTGARRGVVGPLHSDFTAYNVRATPDAIYVTDLAEMPVGVAEQCVAFFWAWCELVKQHPDRSGSALSRIQRFHEEGFGEHLSPYWQIWGVLRQLSYFPPPVELPAGRKRWWHRWRLARARAWLANRVRKL